MDSEKSPKILTRMSFATVLAEEAMIDTQTVNWKYKSRL